MSDHFSGPRAIAGPAGDICDLYAFPSPDTPARLTLVMTIYPEARLNERFSDAITYRFRLRPATLPRVGSHIDVGEEADEVWFDFTFQRPSAGSARAQAGRLVSSLGSDFPFAIDADDEPVDGVRVYAGVRSDPFFIDLPAFERSITNGHVAFSEKGRNSLHGANVLAIVLEVETAALDTRGHGPVWAVAAETRVTGAVPIRIERIGRPEVKNVLLQRDDPLYRDFELRDLYNLEDPYHLSGQYRAAYRSRIGTNLAHLDSLDGRVDWPLENQGAHPLTELFYCDRLIIDLSEPFAPDSYFAIERALLEGRVPDTCGGRWLNDDVMDTLYTLLIGGLGGERIRDGVDAATKVATDRFPFLAPPTGGPLPAVRRVVSRRKHRTSAG